MTSRQVDYLNIVLMGVSFVFALVIPFEAFLFSYAVLGPLHYITEISWLNQRDFFLVKRKHAWFLVITCFILSAQAIYFTLSGHTLLDHIPKSEIGTILGAQFFIGSLLFIAFFITLTFLKAQTVQRFYGWLFLIVFIALFAQVFLPYQYAVFSLMLPTLIHVSIFTAIFILSGALKQNSWSGYAVFGLYIVVCALFFIPGVILPVAAHISDYARGNYLSSGFDQLNSELLRMITPNGNRQDHIDILQHPFGFRIQAFIAFAYTYHYLNWFSKTGMVGWHRLPPKRLAFIIGLWLAAMAVYLYDYRIGLAVLLFFSLLHVILEFPLNHKVSGQVVADLRKRLDFKRFQA